MTLRTKLMVVAVALSMLAVFARSAGTRTQAMPAAGVQVAVGVYDGGQFVKGLTQADFQVLENGEPCTIECLYEINKDAITRQEGNAPAAPVTARRFHLLFQMIDYDAKVAEALRYFITDALLPGDSLSVQTPVKTYVLTPEALAQKPRQILAKEMDQIVRTDIGKGNFVYKGLIRELRGIVAAYEHRNPLANGDEDIVDPTYSQVASLLESYRGPLNKFEALRAVDQDAVLGFAQGLKNRMAGSWSSSSTSRSSGRSSARKRLVNSCSRAPQKSPIL